MTSNQVILAGGSRFVQDLLKRVIQKTPDLHVADQVTNIQQLPQAVQETQSAWIILSRPWHNDIPSVVDRILANYPSIRVLTVTPDGSRIKMRWVEAHEEELFNLTLDDLIAVLRSDTAQAPSISDIKEKPENA